MGESHCWLTHELYKPLLIHGCKVRVASRHVTATSHISVPSSSKQPTSYRCLLLQVFFSFLFFFYSLSSEPVSCNIVVAVASTSPCSHTGNTPSLPHHPLGAFQPPVAPILTWVIGTQKPPCHPHPHHAWCTYKKNLR